MTRTCTVISANVQRSLANIDGVLQRAVRHRYQVVCIQKPPVFFGKVRRHPGFTLYAVNDGAWIWILEYIFDQLHPRGRWVVLTTTASNSYTTIYMSHWEKNPRGGKPVRKKVAEGGGRRGGNGYSGGAETYSRRASGIWISASNRLLRVGVGLPVFVALDPHAKGGTRGP